MLIKTALPLYLTAQKKEEKRSARVPEIAINYKMQQNNCLSTSKPICTAPSATVIIWWKSLTE